jgi:hypothetical protein
MDVVEPVPYSTSLATLERQIGHFDFLRTRLEGLLCVAEGADAEASSRLAEQLECTQARLVELEAEQRRRLSATDPVSALTEPEHNGM